MPVNSTYPFYAPLEYTIISCYGLIAFLSLLGNLAVLVICVRLYKESGSYIIYYGSLSASDIIMSMCFIPQMYAMALGHYITVDYYVCQLWGVLYVTSRITSAVTLAIIALDRLVATIMPHFYRVHNNNSIAAGTVVVCWVVGLLEAFSPYLFQGKYEYYKFGAMCSVSYDLAMSLTYFILTDGLAFILPSVFIFVSVVAIIFKISHNEHQSKLSKASKRITSTLVSVFIVYTACFSIYFVWLTLLISEVISTFPTHVFGYMQNIALLSLSAHCVANPIIYAFKAAQFKKELKHVGGYLEGKICRRYLTLTGNTLHIDQGHVMSQETVFSDGHHSQ